MTLKPSGGSRPVTHLYDETGREPRVTGCCGVRLSQLHWKDRQTFFKSLVTCEEFLRG